MRGSILPRGRADFVLQVAIWLGFALGYQVARALADRGAGEALANARRIVDVESGLGGLYELGLQRRALDAGPALVHALNWTYWLSQFIVLTGGLLWVYLRRNRAYRRLRNTLFAVNLAGLIGYVALPTMPPRLLPELGFVDTLAGSSVSFRSPLVDALANPYAAMPSLHAADALVLAATLVAVTRSAALRLLVALWPLWVWFALVATGNHFWLDVAAGAALGALGVAGGSILARPAPRPVVSRLPVWPGHDAHGAAGRHAGGAMGRISTRRRRLWGIRPGELRLPVRLLGRRRRPGEPVSGPHGRGFGARHERLRRRQDSGA